MIKASRGSNAQPRKRASTATAAKRAASDAARRQGDAHDRGRDRDDGRDRDGGRDRDSAALSNASEISVGTDAAFASSPLVSKRRPLRNISEVRYFFRTNDVPVYVVAPRRSITAGCATSTTSRTTTPGTAHPRVFTPRHKPTSRLHSSEEVNNYLLRDPEVQQSSPAAAGRPKVAMVFFDEETEAICRELGYELILPPRAAQRLDSKIVTTQLGNEAGAPSVPNVLVGRLLGDAACRRRAPARHRPRRADALRRLGQDDLLHRLRSDWDRTRRTSSAGGQGHEADQQHGGAVEASSPATARSSAPS